jgi:hypothetical protein
MIAVVYTNAISVPSTDRKNLTQNKINLEALFVGLRHGQRAGS